MNVAANARQLESFLKEAAEVGQDKPVVITKFIVNAKEIEFDAVAKEGHILNYAISEHVENAGVHSGDATLVLPAQKLFVQTIRQVKVSTGITKGWAMPPHHHHSLLEAVVVGGGVLWSSS